MTLAIFWLAGVPTERLTERFPGRHIWKMPYLSLGNGPNDPGLMCDTKLSLVSALSDAKTRIFGGGG